MGKNRLQDVQQTQSLDKLPNTTQNEKNMSNFLQELQQIRELIIKIETNTQTVAEKHSLKLSAISEQQSKQSFKEIENLNDEITLHSNTVRNKLKKLNQDLESSENKDASYRMDQQQFSNVSKSFYEAISSFNNVQCSFKQKYKERVKRQYKIVNPNVTDEEIDDALTKETGDSIFAQEILSPGHQEAKKALEECKDRHEEILRLEKSIRELHQMFMDVALLVDQQGNVMDQIEFNVGQAEDYTTEAKAQLVEASRLNRSVRKKKILFFTIILLALIAAAIALAIIFSNKKK